MFRLHPSQEQAQSTASEDVGTSGNGRIGGNLPDLFQDVSLFFGHKSAETRRYELSFKSAFGPGFDPPDRATFKTAKPARAAQPNANAPLNHPD